MGELKTTVPAEVAQEIDWNKSGLRGGRLWQVLAGGTLLFCNGRKTRGPTTNPTPAGRVAGSNREIYDSPPGRQEEVGQKQDQL